MGTATEGTPLMYLNYEQILKKNGFEAIPEAEDTTRAFHHELHNTLFNEDSPFDEDQSSIREFPDILDHMLQCSLPLKPGKRIDEGVSHLISKWYSGLSYLDPKYESIQRASSKFGTEVRIFTLSQGTGCSFLFTITDEAAKKFSEEFMDFYSPVDDPEKIGENIQSHNKIRD